MFLFVNAVSLAGLYRDVKCSLPTVFPPPRYSRSAWSRKAAFKRAKTPISQGWVNLNRLLGTQNPIATSQILSHPPPTLAVELLSRPAFTVSNFSSPQLFLLLSPLCLTPTYQQLESTDLTRVILLSRRPRHYPLAGIDPSIEEHMTAADWANTSTTFPHRNSVD